MLLRLALLPIFLLLLLGFRPVVAQAPSPAQIAILNQALGLVDTGKGLEARLLARASGSPLVADLVLYFDLFRDDSTADFYEVAGLLQRHPDWPRQRTLVEKAEEGLNGTESAQALVTFFRQFPPDEGRGAFAYLSAIQRTGGSGLQEAARQSWHEVFFEDEAEEQSFLAAYGRFLTQNDQLTRWRNMVDEDAWNNATRQAQRLGGGYPALTAAREALQKRRRDALTKTGQVPGQLRGDPDLIVDVTNYYYHRGRDGDLDAMFLSLGSNTLGRPDDLWRARFSAAKRNLDDGKPSTAYRIARNHGLSSGGGFAELEWLAGFVALQRLNDPQRAYDHFVAYYNGSQNSEISQGKAAYWAALAAERLGRRQDAQVWLQRGAENGTGFYGQLSAARIGAPIAGQLPAQPALNRSYFQTYRQGDLATAAAALSRVAAPWRGNLFFFALRSRAQGLQDYLALGAMARELGRWDWVVKTGKAARSDGFLLIDYLFPRPPGFGPGYPEQALVLAVARQESEFNTAAISRADARGMMQLLPSTARLVAGQLGIPYNLGRLTSDPAYNVLLGRTYLGDLIQQFGGSYTLALAGYNAGPNRAVRWSDENGDPRSSATDFVLWVEAIPFGETRNYVMRILESLVVYRMLLGERDMRQWQGYNPAGGGALGARLRPCCG